MARDYIEEVGQLRRALHEERQRNERARADNIRENEQEENMEEETTGGRPGKRRGSGRAARTGKCWVRDSDEEEAAALGRVSPAPSSASSQSMVPDFTTRPEESPRTRVFDMSGDESQTFF